jgi:hypothetical protein
VSDTTVTKASGEAPRDRFDLTREQLLSDYAAISKKRRGAAETTALRLRSRQYLDIMAAEASKATLDWAGLRAVLLDEELLGETRLEPMVLAEIGRVLLLQQLLDEDVNLAVTATQEHEVPSLPQTPRGSLHRLS